MKIAVQTPDVDLWEAESAGHAVSHVRAAIEASRMSGIHERNRRELARRFGR